MYNLFKSQYTNRHVFFFISHLKVVVTDDALNHHHTDHLGVDKPPVSLWGCNSGPSGDCLYWNINEIAQIVVI